MNSWVLGLVGADFRGLSGKKCIVLGVVKAIFCDFKGFLGVLGMFNSFEDVSVDLVRFLVSSAI